MLHDASFVWEQLSEMEESLLYAGLMIVALLAGFVDSIAGGGGLITMPSLLSAGIPPHIVLGTNKMVSVCGTFVASLTYIKKKIFTPQLWIACAIATLLGSAMGAMLATLINEAVIRKAVPLIIIGIAVYMLWPKKKVITHQKIGVPNRFKQVISGTVLGGYDGLIGPGTGSFWTLLANTWFRLDLVQASGVARFMNLMSNFSALATFFFLGAVNWRLGLLMGMANMLGGYIGASSAIRYGEKFIRPLFICFVVMIALRLMYIEFISNS